MFTSYDALVRPRFVRRLTAALVLVVAFATVAPAGASARDAKTRRPGELRSAPATINDGLTRDPATGAAIPALPADAPTLHVQAGADRSTADGSAERPYPSIAWAVGHAQYLRKLGQGVRVVVAPGTYREAIEVGAVGTNPPLVIESRKPGGALVTGAEVETRWTPVDATPRWTAPWPERWGLTAIPAGWGGVEVPDGVRRREAVFVDGAPLAQVLTEDALAPGTFLVDEEAGSLVVHPPAGVDTLGDHRVEVARRDRTLRIQGKAANVTVTGFVFEAAAASLQSPMAYVSNASNVLIENNTFRHSSWGGLGVCCTRGVTVRGNRAVDNGGNGLDTNLAHNAVVIGNTITGNNVRGFQHGFVSWSVAGSKNLRLHDAVFRDNVYSQNLARGLWFDTDVKNVLVDRDRSCSNLLSGVFVEAVQGPMTIQDSTFCDNPGGGIVVGTSGNVLVQRTTVANNGYSQLVFSGVRTRTWSDHVTGEVITMGDFENWTLRDNVITSSGTPQLIRSPVIPREDWTARLAAGEITARRNVWKRPALDAAIRMQNQNFPMADWYAMTGDAAPTKASPTTTRNRTPKKTWRR